MSISNFISCFVPLFVAVDALGVLPLFLGLTEGMDRQIRQRTVKEAVFTAMVVAIGFIYLGKIVFRLMGITEHDFMVAGGVLLFSIATSDLLRGEKTARYVESIGVVPLGIPLIVGPAVLTTGLMLIDTYGPVATLAAMTINILIAGGVFLTADFWLKLLGKEGSRAMSKVASLLLAAIAVMMIRKGLILIIKTTFGV